MRLVPKWETRHKNGPIASAGFTLIELVLAVFIFSLVIGIMAVSLTFSLRVWQSQQNRQPSHMPDILDLMKSQLADFDPVPLRFEGEARFLFQGGEYTLSFTTDRSVKAISKGVPVVARYVFQKGEKKLYYAEMPLDPYHLETIQEFLKRVPGKKDQWPHFYSLDVASFSLAYAGGENHPGYSGSWESSSTLPTAVLVKWSLQGESKGSSSSEVMTPNSLFPIAKDTMQKALRTPTPQPQQ